jgi:hypothetical protein
LTELCDRLNRAIEALSGPTKRRGKPPKSPLALITAAASPAASEPATRKKRHFSAAQRKQQAEKMKAYWAARKKAEGTEQPKTKGRKSKKKAEAA